MMLKKRKITVPGGVVMVLKIAAISLILRLTRPPGAASSEEDAFSLFQPLLSQYLISILCSTEVSGVTLFESMLAKQHGATTSLTLMQDNAPECVWSSVFICIMCTAQRTVYLLVASFKTALGSSNLHTERTVLPLLCLQRVSPLQCHQKRPYHSARY